MPGGTGKHVALDRKIMYVIPSAMLGTGIGRGYDSKRTRELLDEIGFDAQIACKGMPAPIQIGKRWVVERTNSWMNGFAKSAAAPDRNAQVIDFYGWARWHSPPPTRSSAYARAHP